MDTQLIEISNRSLFTEYLNHFGIKAPSLQKEWVYTNKEKKVLELSTLHPLSPNATNQTACHCHAFIT